MEVLSSGFSNNRGKAFARPSDDSDIGGELEHAHSSSDSASDSHSRLSLESIGVKPTIRKLSARRISPRRKKNSSEVNQEHHRKLQDTSGEVTQRSWYEFDFAIVIALVSPVGNWLTGGDHIKNLTLIGLLVFYLYQIVEAPWSLYQKARRRKPPSPTPPETPEDRYRELAISELRKVELLCLALTTISPFIGAYTLRYATQAIMGPEIISWFSTGLFVMATGIRPWSHLIERLGQRTADLQNFIHSPVPSESKHDDELRESLASLVKRIDALEASVSRVKVRMEYKAEDILDHVDDAVDTIKETMRKHEKQWISQEERLRASEKSITQLSTSSSNFGKSGLMVIPGAAAKTIQSVFREIIPPKTTLPARQKKKGRSFNEPKGSSKSVANGSTVPTQLEVIMEEDRDGKCFSQNNPFYLMTVFLQGFGRLVFMPVRMIVKIFLG